MIAQSISNGAINDFTTPCYKEETLLTWHDRGADIQWINKKKVTIQMTRE